ncbi:hypothetical protein IMCC20628_04158 [Hoeflea sp. IMCC20628]|nr:hypothetical protein IMCC20628_04158 [Hoeflea sp. IMCC20628]
MVADYSRCPPKEKPPRPGEGHDGSFFGQGPLRGRGVQVHRLETAGDEPKFQTAAYSFAGNNELAP